MDQIKIPSDLEDADEDDDFGSDRDIGGSKKKKKNKKLANEDDEFNQFNDNDEHDDDDMSEDMVAPEDNEN